jgi:DNA-binding transcriptional LysR family regulator
MDRIGVRELECFVAVADNLSFSKAARQLHSSQPPLSRQVQALEGKLGARVFTRSAHGVALTSSGARFLEEARAILRHVDHAAGTIRDESQEETGHLHLAFIAGYLDVKFARLIQKFRKDYPASLVEVEDRDSPGQVRAILAGELDGGFIGTRPLKPLKGLSIADWGQDPLLIALPEEHSLARIAKLRWRHLQGLSWVLISRREAPAFRDLFSKITESHALAVQIVQESNRIQAVLTLVAAGIGVSMVAESVKHLISSGVVFRRLPHPQPIVHYAFAYRTGNDSPALNKFLALLRKSAL